MHVGPAVVKGILSILASIGNGSSWGITQSSQGDFTVTWDDFIKNKKNTKRDSKMSTFQKALVTPMTGEIGRILLDIVTEDDIVRMFRERIANNANGAHGLDSVQLARMIIKYPRLEEVLSIKDISFDHFVIMAAEYPDRFLSRLDIAQLSPMHYRYLFNTGRKAVMRHIYKKCNKEELQKLSIDTWLKLLKDIPSSAKHLHIDKIRNQTHLRRLIESRPTLMKYATLDQMKNSPIAPETWARLLAEIKPKYRALFPVGSKDWIEKSVFVRQLKGRRFKDFKEWSTNLP
jgi:hypothetical protein